MSLPTGRESIEEKCIMTVTKPDLAAIWRGRIVEDPSILSGKPIVKGSRISVELVTDLLEGGRSEDDIMRDYPHITLEDIDACRRYKATGASLCKVTWAELDAWMDGE